MNMALSRQDLEKIIAEALPGFVIVDQPAADAPNLFVAPEAVTPDFRKIQQKLGKTADRPAEVPPESPADDVMTVPVRSPDNPLRPSAASHLKYVYVSNKTGKIVAIQG